MSLTLALQSALTGLNVNQRTMATISHNIANANTEGYSRQVVDLASINIDGRGQGVKVEDVVRKVDEFLIEAIYSQTSEVGRSNVVNEYYDRAQILLGEPGSRNSIDEHINTFFNDLQALADTPERTSSRAAVVESAVNLARELSGMAEGVEELRLAADLEISQGIRFINDVLVDLHSTNEAIANAEAFGTSKADLFDKRDQAIRDLAEFMDVRSYQLEDGQVHIYVGQGLSILDESLHQLKYNKVGSLQTLIEGDVINPIQIQQVDEDFQPIGRPIDLTTADVSRDIERNFYGGRLFGLLQIRDELMPDMLDQMDMLAHTLRESFNAIHNQGTGYPAASEMTGTREVQASVRSVWDGEAMIALLNQDGTPVASPYRDETSGIRPLTLDFSELDSGFGFGEVDVQTIIKEINNHYGIPQNRLEIGNLNQVQLGIVSNNFPGPTPQLEFDFDIENISGETGQFWVQNVTVLDDTGADITNTTDTMPSLTLDAANTYTTSAGSSTVTVTTVGGHNLQVGDVVRLRDPGGGPYNGIPSSDFDGYFTVQSVTGGNTFTVQVNTAAVAGPPIALAGQTADPPYAEVAAGDKTRLQQNGTILANLIGNPNSTYYDIQVSMAVREPGGNAVTFALDAANTFTTTPGSTTVTVTTVGSHNLQAGDVIQLADPGGGPYNGIPSSELGGYFTVQASPSSNTFTIQVNTPAVAGPPIAIAGLTGDTASGNISTTTVTYRVEAPGINTRNDRVSARAVSPQQDGVLHIPTTTQGYLRASLVDENGVELPLTNRSYGDQSGFLKIQSLNPNYTFAIDELDSSQRGQINNVPPVPGTDRGFSYFFELNNFFVSNDPTPTGDTLKNSALNMEVENRLVRTPSLMSSGNLERSNQPADPDEDPLYTFERYSGDQSVAQRLAELGITPTLFAAAGGLPQTNLSFGDFAGEMLGFMSARAISADVKLQNDEILLEGYMERSDAISGVNLDEELANTIIYQNAYTASARVITVTDELFDALLNAF